MFKHTRKPTRPEQYQSIPKKEGEKAKTKLCLGLGGEKVQEVDQRGPALRVSSTHPGARSLLLLCFALIIAVSRSVGRLVG